AALAEFFAHVHHRDRAQKRSFALLHAYWSEISGAYARCLADHEQGRKGAARIREELPLALGRSLRAAAQAARLRCLRYLGIEAETWAELSRRFACGERLGIDDKPFVAYPGEVHSSARAEFLKVLGLSLAALHELPPLQIELASRVLERFAISFAWGRQAKPECNFAIDLSAPAPPGPARSAAAASPSMRYFGGGPALAKLEEIERLSEANLLSEEMRFGKEFTPAQIVTVIRHLRTFLGIDPPRRRYAREGANADLSVVHGFRAICQRVTAIELGAAVAPGDDSGTEGKKRAAMRLLAEEVESHPETWLEKDRSEWGIGVDIPPGKGEWAEPGVACGVRNREDAPWSVGIIRRLEADESGHLHGGFWILSKKPVSVWLRVIGTEGQKASNWETSTGSFSYRYMRAILLPDALKWHEHPVMLIERQELGLGELCEVMVGEHTRTIELVELIEEGADYLRVGFTWRVPEKR
ncbi:MAG: hypothetical protein HYU75_08070, partial [Betaproteobacteria bacterium]|nr:hypothetical protein [Betaproteobacteria bacterium]